MKLQYCTKQKPGLSNWTEKNLKWQKAPAALLWASHEGNRCVLPWIHPPCLSPYPTPTVLSTLFTSISLHKVHRLLKSEIHGNVEGKNSMSHYISVISIMHRWGFNFCNHRQMKDQCMNTESLKEEAKYHKSPLGWVQEDAQTHTNKRYTSAPGNVNVMSVVQSDSFYIICKILFCNITVLHPVLCRGENKPPNTDLRLEATNKHVCVSICT